LGFAQLLLRSKQEPLTEHQRSQVQRIVGSGEHLLALLNDVLALARIESGSLSISVENVELDYILEECREIALRLAAGTEVTIRPERVAAGVARRIRADPTRLRQVLLNLIANAIKYNRPGGEVGVEVTGDATCVTLAVVDTGLGIAKEHHGELFTPFSRLGHENSAIEGTGIGLSLSRKLAYLMGGRLEFDSEQAIGSRFAISLPAGHSTPAADPLVRTETASWLFEPPVRYRVLYVEDNPGNLVLMQGIFDELQAFELLTAVDGERGVECARRSLPQLILMDLNLPGMSGFDALTALKVNPRTASIPVIAITADAMPATADRCQRAGFDAYLTKPLHIERLVEHLGRVFQQ
jgi:CheY-like chemotaxis protein